ncbi:hypothetical protein [Clostridium sp. DMHC 10]|uniref:hypothetical protein n=1 Tax=Clostridium sp. DMHC 10 TaxID=747377 RepID=UPI00069F3172|nr:hypothetical protein [Clostridium sp. DMHC 10]
MGIDVSQLSYNVINAAVSSQDLFYDYQWARLILDNKKMAHNVKFAVIGMSYYSFEYDLSKSNLKNRVYNYYPFFKKTRNHPFAKDMVENYIKFERVASKIFKKDYNIVFHNFFKGNKDTWWNNMISQVMDEKIIEKNKWIVEHDCDKDYPETVKENVGIIREYILLLKLYNITPIIVICPTSKYYYLNFSNRIKKEYENIMNKIKEEFDIEVFDYFASNVFSDKDFYNVSHLNKNGTKKFTELLNKKLIDLCDK